jgi:hypothetical protein
MVLLTECKKPMKTKTNYNSCNERNKEERKISKRRRDEVEEDSDKMVIKYRETMARDRRKWTKGILETKWLQRTAALVTKKQMSTTARTINQKGTLYSIYLLPIRHVSA